MPSWAIRSSTLDELLSDVDEDLLDDWTEQLRTVETEIRDTLGPQYRVGVTVTVRRRSSRAERAKD